MLNRTSITPDEIASYKKEWPRDRYIVREVNGDYGQHWAVCDAGTTWNIITLSYTREEAEAILALFKARKKRRAAS